MALSAARVLGSWPLSLGCVCRTRLGARRTAELMAGRPTMDEQPWATRGPPVKGQQGEASPSRAWEQLDLAPGPAVLPEPSQVA